VKIEKHQRGNVTIMVIQGVIKVGESASIFSNDLDTLLAEGSGEVLIDMSAIDYVDSTGLGELVGYLQRFEKEGRRLALLRPQTRILNLLKLTKLDSVFQIFETEDEAIAAMNG